MPSIEQQQISLEEMVDDMGLQRVLSLLADVCQDKANHLCENRQDHRGAYNWKRAGIQCGRFSMHPRILDVS